MVYLYYLAAAAAAAAVKTLPVFLANLCFQDNVAIKKHKK